MKKKIISVALVFLMCLSIFPTFVSAKEVTYLKDMIGTFSGTYFFSNDITYGDTYQTGTASITLNENELTFEMIMVFYHIQSGKKTVDCNIATKFKFDETGYNDWDAATFVDGKPQYVEGGLIPGYKIGDLLNDTEVEYLDKENRYKISVFGMMDFYFCDVQDGKSQKAVYNDVVFDRTENDKITIPTPFIGRAEAPTKITSTTTEWSGWIIVEDKVEINGDVKLTGDTNLILADGAELTVNGTVDAGGYNDRYMLTVYAQNAGTGAMTVIGQGSMKAGYIGSITVNGGNVNINGGGSYYGIYLGRTVKVAGGVLNVNGSNGGGVGVYSCTVTVTGGELNIVGGNSDTYGGCGMCDSIITVTDGVAALAGGVGRDGYQNQAFDGDDDWIDARIFYSTGDKTYYPLTKYANRYPLLKLFPKIYYIDVDGVKQTVANPREIKEDIHGPDTWKGWTVVYGNVNIYDDVTLNGDTNLILADGAELIVNAPIICNGHLLTVYAQSTDNAGTITVNGPEDTKRIFGPFYGTVGNITVNGGNVNINGGAKIQQGFAGVHGNVTVTNGNVTITGGKNGGCGVEGDVTVLGGKTVINAGKTMSDTGKGAAGVINGNIRVCDGELYVNGSGDSYGVEYCPINVEGGKAVINGGNRGGKAYIGFYEDINAAIETSTDGVTYIPYNGEGSHNIVNRVYSLRLTPKVVEGIGDDDIKTDSTAPQNKDTDKTGNNDTSTSSETGDTPTSPKTGITSNTTLWFVLFAVSLSVIVACITYEKKRKEVDL